MKESLEQLITWSKNHIEYLETLENGSSSGRFADLLHEFTHVKKTAESFIERTTEVVDNAAEVYALFERSEHLYKTLISLLEESGALSLAEHLLLVSGVEEEQRKDDVSSSPAGQPVPIGGHNLPPLPYPYNALEPHIDEKTMRLHHDKHHKSYVEGLNKAEKEMQRARQKNDFVLIKHWEREAAFNGAGHYLHTIFWHNMSPNGGGRPTGAIAQEIDRTFGSFDAFKAHFSAAAEKVEGGGWALLVWSPRSHRMEILQAEKHQNLSQQDVIPLLVLDVWEHSYYLKYNDRRPEYIDAWWNVVNWSDVNERFLPARKLQWTAF
ncbi:superoxide dismutase [Aneurinibacillus terranovensis]|uniref:superoxide dismutase n=1 Tax=Aneurinibacillus terranovensis TaxID=278991 RepID=UPI0004204FC4|nr:superoxide dismutase [Aneurinibacillus terranovensis]